MASQKSLARVGVDIGGTFTDVALEINDRMFSAKLLTDYAAPERAIISGIEAAAAQAGIGLSDIGLIIHGTTLATNALIERHGAHTALITTEGFRDVIEMRTESRFEQYDLNITLPAPLIERYDRLTLKERISAQGDILIEPSDDDIARLIDIIEQRGYESVAIGFIHAYANGVHERKVREALLGRMPGISVSISSEVSPQIREFERFNTVCANAYVRPRMESYLSRLVQSLESVGIHCPVHIMHSGGGIMSVENAAKFPVRLVESGPAGGAIFAANIAARYRLDSVLSFDMGGTTAKICLIDELTPKTANTFEVARTYRFKKGSGMPISIPVVEMVEIGAGGGSIASVDSMSQIRVGPQSAGSEPGPACYQRGGTHPTVTDADLMLGRLDPANFAAGTIALSTDKASESLHTAIGKKLSLSVGESAYGVIEMVDENMSNAARVHAVESGKDISTYTMITFGGAGPLHAARICEKTGIQRFIVPPGAGVGSAIGFLRAPFGYESVRSARIRLSNFNSELATQVINDLKAEVRQFINSEDADHQTSFELKIYMRYVGQGWEVPVSFNADAQSLSNTSLLKNAFEETYTKYFARPIEGLDIETVSWALKASSKLPPVQTVQITTGSTHEPQSPLRAIFDADLGQEVQARIIERATLPVGMTVKGPAIITENETSTLVTSSFCVTAQSDGCLLVTRNQTTVL